MIRRLSGSETAIARLEDGGLWKYSRYLDSTPYWSNPGTSGRPTRDVLLTHKQATPAPEYKGPIHCEVTVKGAPVADEFELYNRTIDPMELSNRYGDPACSAQQSAMVKILADQRAKRWLSPLSGMVPRQESDVT